MILKGYNLNASLEKDFYTKLQGISELEAREVGIEDKINVITQLEYKV
jgi:hypothetical protein